MKLEIRFNGCMKVKVLLTPDNADEKALLDLAFNGRVVTSIKGDSDSGIELTLGRSDIKPNE